jgi:hypothetical protein
VGVTGPADAAVVEVKAQIQMLADEIAALRAIPGGDPHQGSANRVVALKAATIRSLWTLLPGITTRLFGDGPAGNQRLASDGGTESRRCHRVPAAGRR